MKCGVCPNQAFVSRTERELLAHLQGRQVMGIYPLLADDTCWLLAIDLDGRSWRTDLTAFREACRELELVPRWSARAPAMELMSGSSSPPRSAPR